MRGLLLLILIVGNTLAAPAPEKVLFIGNSYTGHIRKAVTGLFAASPHKSVQLEFITPGGRNLGQHLANPGTLERITSGGWDLIVLQDQSQTPALQPAAFLKNSAALNALITKAGARTVYYETWGRRDGDRKNLERFPTYDAMQTALSTAYGEAATRDRALLVPVGTAWRKVRRDHPPLGVALYAKDGSHPSPRGALLAAACLYGAIFGESPAELPYDHGLPAADAALLRKIAAETTRRPR